MDKPAPTYEEGLALLREFNQSAALLRHAYAAEGVMRYLAQKHGEDEEKWTVVGLVRPSKSVSDLKANSVMEKMEGQILCRRRGPLPH
ncbi:MAG: hypothetical protein ACLFPD_00970 [Desulfosudaceae bacterium]